ncbi:hypothetical protein ACLM5J_03855 [Nocardioides sp. Bht2]|uniref:hypothetical protein n=1 Tax=Nocardioides sp. Bht2 TaxID=3392297 RepID=UPI0039B3BC0E
MSSRSAPGKRAAERPPSRLARAGVARRPRAGSLWGVVAVLVVVGFLAELLSIAEFGPQWLDQAGAVAITGGFTAALAARTGGRPVVAGALALLYGLVAVVWGNETVLAGATVGSAVVTTVLAVMLTVPAARFLYAAREVLIALAVSGVGAFAVVGMRPHASLDAFDFVTLALAFLLALGLVFRLGAGFHGVGRRGLVMLLVGGGLVIVAITYAEVFRRYGSPALLDPVFDAVRWWRAELGAVPRPIVTLVGVPALLWGCHMRARRRQGWWLCVFGVAATSNVATVLLNPETGWLEALLIIVYSVLPGLALGYAVVRLDQRLTGPRGARARRAEEALAVRPEPRRFSPLL